MLQEKRLYKIADLYNEDGCRTVVKLIMTEHNTAFSYQTKTYKPNGEKDKEQRTRLNSYNEIRSSLNELITKCKFARVYLNEENEYTDTPIITWN